MKSIKYIIVGLLIISTPSCQDIVEDLNDHPTRLTPDVIPALKLLTGAQLANTLVQAGHFNRIAGMYSGQLIGFQGEYLGTYRYDYPNATGSATWNRAYQGVVPQVRLIREKINDSNELLTGICKAMEAHAIGTLASLLGDVPYQEIFDESFPNPKFDAQSTVFTSLQLLLDDAIVNLENASASVITEDIYYQGDKTKWIEAAWTLKARYYIHTKEYSNAYTSALNGISSAGNTMYFTPIGETGLVGDKNTFFTLLSGTRAGDMGTGSSHLMQLIDPNSTSSRQNAKTDEKARFEYYTINENPGTNPNLGIADEFEPMKLVSFEENTLILAEAGLRDISITFSTALGHLNNLRQYLNSGTFLNANFNTRPFTYADYTEADFQAGGIENLDNIAQDRALLREIIEERYVSGFLTFMPFDDARRLRKSDSDVAIPIPFNTATATAQPERFLYPSNERDTNENTPSGLTLFTVTEVNQ